MRSYLQTKLITAGVTLALVATMFMPIHAQVQQVPDDLSGHRPSSAKSFDTPRKNEIKTLLDAYVDTRKHIYTSIQERDGALTKELNSKKHVLVNEIFSLIGAREHDSFYKSFTGIVGSKIAECSVEDMKNYITASKRDKYFQCLDLQKTSLHEAVDQNVGSRTTIVVDYGGNKLGDDLKRNPVRITNCDVDKANSGDIDQQVCMAQVYLTKKDCIHANKWALKAFEQDKWNTKNEAVLDLIGILEHTGECVTTNHEDL